jgi:hypothetical protein
VSIDIRSSWIVVDGVVWPADALPKSAPIGGKVTAARAMIREAVLKLRKR